MIHETKDQLFVDTAFITAITYKIPGAELCHMGFGEFYLKIPAGRVDFDRMRGVDFEGQSGRSHLVYGRPEAVRSMMQAAETNASEPAFARA
jgi:hypothetical protein